MNQIEQAGAARQLVAWEKLLRPELNQMARPLWGTATQRALTAASFISARRSQPAEALPARRPAHATGCPGCTPRVACRPAGVKGAM